MDKIIVSVTAIVIIFLFLLISRLWYRYFVPQAGDDVLFMMRMSRIRLVIGLPGVIFGSIMTIVPIIFFDDRIFTAFITFYIFTLFGLYVCIMILLWRCAVREDSLTFYMPLLPAKEIKFHEIDFVHYKDNQTYGLSGQKTLVGYHNKKKLFSIEEDIIGFPLLLELLCEHGKVDYAPAMENPTAEKTLSRVPVMETFSVTAKTGDKVREVLIDLLFLFPCSLYILWNQAEFELIYQIIALIMLLFLVPNFPSTMLRKVTVDFRTIAVRNSLGVTKTYEIRQITEVAELENHIVLYAGEQKIVKIAKDSKNFQYLFERLLRSEAGIYRKF